VPDSLFWVVLLPIVMGFVAFALPRGGAAARAYGIVVSLIELALVAGLYGDVGRQASIPWFSVPWIAAFHFGSSQLSLLLCLMLAVITVAAVIVSDISRPRDFIAQLLLLEGTMMGLFLARDLLVFALLWDAMLVPVFIMLVNWGEGTSAAWRFLIYNGAAGLGLLLATAAYGILTGSTDVLAAGHAPSALSPQAASWIFAGLALAYAVKTPAWPFHTWMPETYVASPAPLAAVISSVQSKSGIYALLVVGFGLFPQEMHRWAPVLTVLGLIGMLYGSFVAMWYNDAKRVLAYSSLSHLGLLFLGIFSFNHTAIVGVIVYAIGHGLFSAMMFLVVGYIERREGTRLIDRLGGLGLRNPKLGGAMMIGSMALLGLPGLAGFAGELLALIGVWASGEHWVAAIALIPIVLASVYMLRVLLKAIWGPELMDIPVRPDLTWWEIAAVAPLAVGLLVLGLWPNLVAPAANEIAPAGSGIAAAAPRLSEVVEEPIGRMAVLLSGARPRPEGLRRFRLISSSFDQSQSPALLLAHSSTSDESACATAQAYVR